MNNNFSLKKCLFSPIINLTGFMGGIFHENLLKRTLSVFVYHDVSNHPSEFSRLYNLNVFPTIFDFQIKFIKNKFTIISPDDLLSSPIPPKAALITFDDGFRSYFKNAIPILESHEVPSINFLNMELFHGAVFWSGLITYLCEKRQDFRHYLKGFLSDKIFNKKTPLFLFCSRNLVRSYLNIMNISFEKEVSQFVGEFATEQDLREASAKTLVYYGNHLFNHDVPILMSDDELVRSYFQNDSCLKKYNNYRNIFSFPFGQPGTCFHRGQIDLLRDQGAKKVFRSSGRINRDSGQFCLDRISLSSFHNTPSKIWFQLFKRLLL